MTFTWIFFKNFSPMTGSVNKVFMAARVLPEHEVLIFLSMFFPFFGEFLVVWTAKKCGGGVIKSASGV